MHSKTVVCCLPVNVPFLKQTAGLSSRKASNNGQLRRSEKVSLSRKRRQQWALRKVCDSASTQALPIAAVFLILRSSCADFLKVFSFTFFADVWKYLQTNRKRINKNAFLLSPKCTRSYGVNLTWNKIIHFLLMIWTDRIGCRIKQDRWHLPTQWPRLTPEIFGNGDVETNLEKKAWLKF